MLLVVFSELSQGTRLLMWSVLGFGALLGADRVAARVQTTGVSFSFKNIATEAGLVAKTIYGGLDTNRYLLETTGTGAAAFDYDSDGWIDIFLVNGTTLEGFPSRQGTDEPPVSQQGQRHVRGRDCSRRPCAGRMGAGRVCRRLRQRRP